jgi:hypothetical protein
MSTTAVGFVMVYLINTVERASETLCVWNGPQIVGNVQCSVLMMGHCGGGDGGEAGHQRIKDTVMYVVRVK